MKHKVSRATLTMMAIYTAMTPDVFRDSGGKYLGGVRIPEKRLCKCGNKIGLETSDICKECFIKLRSK